MAAVMAHNKGCEEILASCFQMEIHSFSVWIQPRTERPLLINYTYLAQDLGLEYQQYSDSRRSAVAVVVVAPVPPLRLPKQQFI